MKTTDEIMGLADAFATGHRFRDSNAARARAALRNAINELVEQAAWAHHTPALLSEADAAADRRQGLRGETPLYTAPPQASQPNATSAALLMECAATLSPYVVDGTTISRKDVRDLVKRIRECLQKKGGT